MRSVFIDEIKKGNVRVSRLLIFLGFLFLTLLFLLFSINWGRDVMDLMMYGVSVMSFLLALFEFFRKK